MKNKGNMISQKENDNSPATKFKGTEHCFLNDKEIMNKFIIYEEIQPATRKLRQFNEPRNKIIDQEFFI